MRYKVYYGGRGGAKSWAFAQALLAMGLSRPIRVLCARELQKSIKDSVHKLLSDVIKSAPEFDAHYDAQAQSIKGKNGTEFSFSGLKHNATEIKSFEGVDYVWVEEAQAVSDNSWEILVPTIRKEGSEIWICFNPKNPTDPTWRRFVQRKRFNAIVKKVNWRDNPFFPKVLNDERLDDKENAPDAYEHIWEGEFDTRFSGSVYAKWIKKAYDQGRVKKGVYDPDHPVHTAWDLGYDDTTAIIFWQKIGKECRIIFSYEASGEDVEHYCAVLNGNFGHLEEQYGGNIPKIVRVATERCKTFKLGNHYVPHDAAYKLLAAGGRSIVQQAYALGIKMMVVPSTSQQNQIEATRKVLGASWFEEDDTVDLIHAANSYHFEHDDERKVFKSHPVHDWSSHYCDALEIIGQVWQKELSSTQAPAPKFIEQATANDLFWGNSPSSSSINRI